MMLLGAVLAYQWMLFYAGIKASNVSIGILAFSTVGFFTAVFEPLVEKRRPSAAEILISLITVCGIALIFHFDSRYRLGLFYGTLSAAGASLIAIYMKRWGRRHNPATVLVWQFAGGALGISLGLVPFYLLFPGAGFLPASAAETAWLAVYATFITLGMYFLQMATLRRISAFTMNLTYNLEPVYSIIIAMAFLGEARELAANFWCGLALVAISVLLQTARALRA